MTFNWKQLEPCHKFKSCKITPSPIKESPENARTLNTLPFSWNIYFPAKYVMKNFSPFVTGIIVETPALVEANVQTNVTLKNEIEIIEKYYVVYNYLYT